MLEALALPDQIGRHVAMIVDGDLVVADDARQLVLLERRVLIVTGGSSGRMTRCHTAPSCGLQSMKMVFMLETIASSAGATGTAG